MEILLSCIIMMWFDWLPFPLHDIFPVYLYNFVSRYHPHEYIANYTSAFSSSCL